MVCGLFGVQRQRFGQSVRRLTKGSLSVLVHSGDYARLDLLFSG
jgi:hypothetical protein